MTEATAGKTCAVNELGNTPAQTNERARKIVPGWYVPTKGYVAQASRHVFVVSRSSHGSGTVVYGEGGERHYRCSVRAFRAWIKRYTADFNPAVVASNKPAPAQLEIA